MRSDGYRRDSRVRTRGGQLFSVLQVLALAVATLVLLPVVVEADQTDPFSFQAPGDRTFGCAFTGEGVLSDTMTSCRMSVVNTSVMDASLFMFVDGDSIRVMRCPNRSDQGADMGDYGECVGHAERVEVPRTDPAYERFVGAWAISMRAVPSGSDEPVAICEPRGLGGYDGGERRGDHSQMCHMGVLEGLHSSPSAARTYLVDMTLRDDGTDQTTFNGWDLHFDFVVRARQ